MPKTKQVIEYDYNEFEQLVIETFGFMKDWSVIAAEEWNNDSDHQFTAESIDSEYDQKDLDEIYAAAVAYQEVLGSQPDPYITHPRQENEVIGQARQRLADATEYNTRLLFAGLVEKGKIEPGDYIISVCW